MKTLSKFIATVLFFAAVFLSPGARAQNIPVNTFRLNFGVESGVTTGHIVYASKTYFGATSTLQYGLSKNFALTLTSGYYYFPGTVFHSSMGMIPVKLGLKYFVGQHFYFSGEAGVGIALQRYNYIAGLEPITPKSSRLLLSPGIGYAIKAWDFNLHYENIGPANKDVAAPTNGYGLVGLRVSYGFGL
jgi:hypothetical protein